MTLPLCYVSCLTGRIRGRPVGWFCRRVGLQVEVRTDSFSTCPPPPGRDRASWHEKMRERCWFTWRDALPTDLDTLQLDAAVAIALTPRICARNGCAKPAAHHDPCNTGMTP